MKILSYQPALSHIILVWGKMCYNSKSFQGFCFCFFVSGSNLFLFKKEERKQPLPLPCFTLHKDAILANFFPLGMLFGREFTSSSTPQVLCGHSLTAAPFQPTITQLFISSDRHGCFAVIWIVQARPCVSARFFQEHHLADCAAQLRFRAQSLRSVFAGGGLVAGWMCSVTVTQLHHPSPTYRSSVDMWLGNKFRLCKVLHFLLKT